MALVVFSDENRFYLYACDGRYVYGVDLVSVIFRCTFAHDRQAPPQVSWCGGPQLQLAVKFVVSAE